MTVILVSMKCLQFRFVSHYGDSRHNIILNNYNIVIIVICFMCDRLW